MPPFQKVNHGRISPESLLRQDDEKRSNRTHKKKSGCFLKWWYPKMDGENNGKPYFLMDDLGVPLFLETPI